MFLTAEHLQTKTDYPISHTLCGYGLCFCTGGKNIFSEQENGRYCGILPQAIIRKEGVRELKLPTIKRNHLLIGGPVLLLLLLLLLVLFLSGKEPVIHTYAELSELPAEAVQKLAIREAAGGEQVVVEDEESIAAFLEILTPLTFQEEQDRESKPGWTHMVELYRGEGRYLRLVFAGDEVEMAFYEQGQKERDAQYKINDDLTVELEQYYARVLDALEKAREAALEEIIPTEITVQEIDPAICVVINNHPSARPSSGLQEADIIYEFLVEGGSTRYIAVFKRKHLEDFTIGPVRSLRPYFAFQSLEYGGIVAHSGYSARTMQIVSGLGIIQIGDVGKNFWRDSSRRAPHNLYTSIDNLYRAVLNRIEVVERTYELEREVKVGYLRGLTVEVRYSGHNKVNYIYDQEAGVYHRFINDNPHMDRETGEQYYAERVIIRETSHRNVPNDPDGVLDIDLKGSGAGLLYEKGRKYDITWESTGRETTFYYSADMPVEPIAGTTWIQVVRR